MHARPRNALLGVLVYQAIHNHKRQNVRSTRTKQQPLLITWMSKNFQSLPSLVTSVCLFSTKFQNPANSPHAATPHALEATATNTSNAPCRTSLMGCRSINIKSPTTWPLPSYPLQCPNSTNSASPKDSLDESSEDSSTMALPVPSSPLLLAAAAAAAIGCELNSSSAFSKWFGGGNAKAGLPSTTGGCGKNRRVSSGSSPGPSPVLLREPRQLPTVSACASE
mmetsp:Transcript_8130/g.13701  ORF Transcript_8130/g.13701 Transcript_8130/m.13701 type:complete len:223 (-) Transcript_8130:1354-2022(-)